MCSERTVLMTGFLDKFFDVPYRVESLAGDASFRRYHRIYADSKSYLLMDAPPDKENVALFIEVAHILSQAVNVPDILQQDLDKGFLLLQDFGQVEFAHKLDESDNQALYALALTTLADLQTINPSQTTLAAYSDEKLDEEMELFWQWFLPYIDVVADDETQALWADVKQKIIIQVQQMPKVVVHRDYHSRNLMIDKASDKLGVIDFQDALVGSYTYDVVSLVRDAYIKTDEAWVEARLIDAYRLMQIDQRFGVDLDRFIQDINVMGVQRHLKVLGIFVRLYRRDGKARYLADIPKVMRDLLAELDWLCQHSGGEAKTVWCNFRAWLDKAVLPAYQIVFEQH